MRALYYDIIVKKKALISYSIILLYMYLKHAANLCSSVGSLDIQLKIRRPPRERYRRCHVTTVPGVELIYVCRNTSQGGAMDVRASAGWGWIATRGLVRVRCRVIGDRRFEE